MADARALTLQDGQFVQIKDTDALYVGDEILRDPGAVLSDFNLLTDSKTGTIYIGRTGQIALFNGNLQVNGDTRLGNAPADTLTINSATISLTNDIGHTIEPASSVGVGKSLTVRAGSSSTTSASSLLLYGGNSTGVAGGDVVIDGGGGSADGEVWVGTSSSLVRIGRVGQLAHVYGSLQVDGGLQVDGSTKLGNAPADTLTINSQFIILTNDTPHTIQPASIAAVGVGLTIWGGNSSTTTGGALALYGGNSTGTGGGWVFIDGGSGTTGGTVLVGTQSVTNFVGIGYSGRSTQVYGDLRVDGTTNHYGNVVMQAGTTLSTTSSGNIQLPNNASARFKIESTAVGSTVTAPNLDTLTNGSTGVTLHTHAINTGVLDQSTGRITANGAVTNYLGVELPPLYADGTMGCGLNYSKTFSSGPSSWTWSITSSGVSSSTPSTWNATTQGIACYWSTNTGGGGAAGAYVAGTCTTS